jgi:PIN domain nuclease of toxin-antitoxin system
VKLLLDTHIWIWLVQEPDRIAPQVLKQIDQAEALLLSAASVWELAIKAGLGKLRTVGGAQALVGEIVRELSPTELAISSEHALLAASLPALHKDPFDRMLVAQAQAAGVPLVTADEQVRAYGGATVWARG